MALGAFETHLRDVQRFYETLDRLETSVGGRRTLSESDGRMDWPGRGLYFFFELDEERTTSGAGLRVTRVGTHALASGSKSTLWGRLRAHRGSVGGPRPGGGNHRGSIFRLHVGTALIDRDDWPVPVTAEWGVGSGAKRNVREREYPLERAVSEYIGSMPFLWIEVDDEPGPKSMRGYIERNAIALLSNYHSRRMPIDPPSDGWLGHRADREEVRRSGLWNVNHVAEEYDPGFLDAFQSYAS